MLWRTEEHTREEDMIHVAPLIAVAVVAGLGFTVGKEMADKLIIPSSKKGVKAADDGMKKLVGKLRSGKDEAAI